VIVTSDQKVVVENDPESAFKPKISREYILREAKVENDAYSWIAAEIKVRNNSSCSNICDQY
jgi:hypothetical protein